MRITQARISPLCFRKQYFHFPRPTLLTQTLKIYILFRFSDFHLFSLRQKEKNSSNGRKNLRKRLLRGLLCFGFFALFVLFRFGFFNRKTNIIKRLSSLSFSVDAVSLGECLRHDDHFEFSYKYTFRGTAAQYSIFVFVRSYRTTIES